jgi:hypothetical protein
MFAHGPIPSRHDEPPEIAPEFIEQVEDELYHRLGWRVTIALGDGILAAKVETGPPTPKSVVAVMDSGPFLHRKRAAEWADSLERKINGEDSSGRVSERAEDVEHLFAEIQKSPSPEQTGAFVLTHVGDYDDEFFEALTEVIVREKAHRRFRRAHQFEALQEYLRVVRRRARKGETGQMWRELAHGAAQEKAREAAGRPGRRG